LLDIKSNTDLVQIRPAFGGNIMAQIMITDARPQFATVRYRVMEPADKVADIKGSVELCDVTDDLARSRIKVVEVIPIHRAKSISEEEILVVAGRGVKTEKELDLVQQLADSLGGQLCYTRPMVEEGHGDTSRQIGLSGRTVKPKLIITCGVSGAIQFTAGMNGSECIVAIDRNPEALIFNIANYCIIDDFNNIIPGLIQKLQAWKEVR
jgi:electron transfer flavoprotein alpha subunit